MSVVAAVPAQVCVVRGDEPAALIAAALGRPDSALAGRLAAVRGERAVVLAVLSPPAPANARLVETLLDHLFDVGAADVTLGAILAQEDIDRGCRDVGEMAAAAGYRGRTPAGRAYDVIDLCDRLISPSVGAGSILSAGNLAARWEQAQFRVVVARAASDATDGYSGCLAALAPLAQLPGAQAPDVVAALLECLPPHLAVLDALVASHGPDGRHILRELDTHTVVAGTDALSVDCRLADLVGEDRSASPVVRAVLQHTGAIPAYCATDEDRSPFAAWTGPHPLVRHAVSRAGASEQVRRLIAAASGGADRGATPDDPLLAGLRSLLTPLVAASDEPASRALLVGLLGSVAAIGDQVHGWQGTMAKHRVPRVVVPLGFSPTDWPDEAYDGLPEFLAPLHDALATLPTRENPSTAADALRWRYLDGAVLFTTERVLAAPFDEFVARVDVAQGISMMADYLGGRRVVHQGLAPAPAGRTRQAERNVYLPQPNYLAHWGGEPIDVCKIELVEREPGWHSLHWRTVCSPNGSAAYDDGVLTFADAGPGRTLTSVSGRQQFTLPLIWRAIDLDRVPEVKDELVQDAYRRFFSATFDNLEACFEGRDFRIGCEPDEPGQPLATRTLHLMWELATSWLGDRMDLPTQPPRTAAPTLDVHGFRHFSGSADRHA